MRLLFVLNDINIKNGVAKFTCDWASYFSKKGYEVFIISLYSDKTNPFFHLSKKVKVINVRKSIRFKNKKPSFASQLKMSKLINSVRPECSIIQSTFIYHSLPYITGNKILVEHVPIDLIPRKNIIRKLLLYPFYKNIVCVSKASANLYNKRHIHKAIYIPNAIFEDFDKTKLSNMNCCAIGRFIYWKHIPFIVESFIKVHEKFPNVILNIYGGDDKYEATDTEKIAELINRNNMTEYVRLHGFVDNIKDELNNNSIFLFASSNKEAFGISLLEAMNAGLPVVAVKSNTSINLAKNGGIILTDFDCDNFANEIIKLLKNPPYLKEQSLNAINNCKKYTAEKIAKQWISLF